MYNSQQNVHGLGATQIAVGLSALVRVSPPPYQIATTMKVSAGGSSGTLFICVAPGFGASTSGAAAASLIGNGYGLASTEVFNIGGPAAFYLSATGVTMTCSIIFGFSSGSSYV